MRSRTRFKRVLILGAAILWAANALPAAALPAPWASLTPDELVRESRAAFHLGWMDPQSLPADPALAMPTAIELAEAALAAPGASGETLRKAHRIRLQVLDRRGKTAAWEAAFAALPPSLPDVPQAEWDRQKLLWSILHDGALYKWGKVKSALAQYNAANLKKEPKADFVLVKSRSEIRENPGGNSGYFDLANEIASAADWEIDDPYFDPYFGQADLSQLDTWSLIAPILDILGANPDDPAQKSIGLRRWFEFAAPSVLNPMGSLFPDAPSAAQGALRMEFRQKAQLFAPAAGAPIPAAGGFRELLARAIRVENLAYTGQAHALLGAVEALPAGIDGIPAPIWNAHKTGWRMIGLAGTLAIGDAVDAIPAVKSAAPLLPPSPMRAYVYSLLGLAQLSQSIPEGNEQFAKAFLIAIPHPALAQQMIRGLLNGTDGVQARRVLDILAEEPYQPADKPQVLAVRSLFAVKFAPKFPEAERPAVLEQALRDGCWALDALERRQEPSQIHWRDELRESLVSAAAAIGGPTAGERAASGLDSKPVRQNPELQKYVSNPGGPANSVDPVFSVVSDFEAFDAESLKSDSPPLDALAKELDDAALKGAVASVPENFYIPRKVRSAKAIYDEAARRGLGAQSFPAAQASRIRVRRAEIMLNYADQVEAAKADLEAVKADSAADSTAKTRAATILEALGEMRTRAAFDWANDWLIVDEKEGPGRRTYIHTLLAAPLATAAERPDVLAYLNDLAYPPLLRMHYCFNIAQARLAAGNETAAMASFTKMIDISDAELVGDDVIRYVAESWRLMLWVHEADRAATPEEARAIHLRIADYARARLSTLGGTDEHRYNLATYGRNSALYHLFDMDLANWFGQFLTTPPKTRLW